MSKLILAVVLAALCCAQVPRSGTKGGRAAPAPVKPPELPPMSVQLPDARTTARIEGQVISITGAKLAGASMELRASRAASSEIIKSTSDGEGTFVFDLIEPGDYNLSASLPGYVRTGQSGTSIAVTLQRGEKKTGVVVRMIPGATISGRIVDQNGDPLPKTSVSLLRKFRANGHSELRNALPVVNSAADGTFSFSGVTPGRYYVSVKNSGTTTYYPGVAEPSLAVPVEAIAGTDSAGIKIRLASPQAFHIRGQVLDPDTRAPADAEVLLVSNESVIDATLGQVTARVKDGYFQFDRVLPGSYILQAYPIAAKAADGASRMPPLAGRAIVNVSRGDLDDVVVQFQTGASISGRVAFEGGSPVDTVRQLDFDIASGPAMGRVAAVVAKDGSFSLSGIPPGSYRIRVNGCVGSCAAVAMPPGHYVKSIRFNGHDVTAKALDLTAGGSGTVDILISPGAAEVTVLARDSENRPVPNARVSIWSGDFYQVGLTRYDGSFDFRELAPGEYQVLAWERIDPGIDAIPEFRDKSSSKAVKFKVDAGGRLRYDVTVIGRQASDAEAAKLP